MGRLVVVAVESLLRLDAMFFHEADAADGVLQVVFGVPAARLLAVYRHSLLRRFVLPDDPRKEYRPGQFNAGVELSAFYQLPPAGPVRFILYYLK